MLVHQADFKNTRTLTYFLQVVYFWRFRSVLLKSWNIPTHGLYLTLIRPFPSWISSVGRPSKLSPRTLTDRPVGQRSRAITGDWPYIGRIQVIEILVCFSLTTRFFPLRCSPLCFSAGSCASNRRLPLRLRRHRVTSFALVGSGRVATPPLTQQHVRENCPRNCCRGPPCGKRNHSDMRYRAH